MHTSLQLVDLAKQRLALAHGLTLPMTDYRLAKLMGFRPQTISQWRSGKTHIGTEFARKFAESCELPLEYVYACIEHERAASADVRLILERIAKKFHAAAVILSAGMIIACSVFPAHDASAADFNSAKTTYLR